MARLPAGSVDLAPNAEEVALIARRSPDDVWPPSFELVGPTSNERLDFARPPKSYEIADRLLEVVVRVTAASSPGEASRRIGIGFERVADPFEWATAKLDRKLVAAIHAEALEDLGDEAATRLTGAARDEHWIEVGQFADQLSNEVQSDEVPIELDRRDVRSVLQHFPSQGALVVQWNEFIRQKETTLGAIQIRADREADAILKAFGRDTPPRNLASFLYRQATLRANPEVTDPPEVVAHSGFLFASGEEGGISAQC